MSILISRAKPASVPKVDKPKNEYLWEAKGDRNYEVKYPGDNYAKLVQQTDGRWGFEVCFKTNTVTGTRDTLELAYKAADQHVYLNDHQCWLKTRSGPVLSKFSCDIDSLFD